MIINDQQTNMKTSSFFKLVEVTSEAEYRELCTFLVERTGAVPSDLGFELRSDDPQFTDNDDLSDIKWYDCAVNPVGRWLVLFDCDDPGVQILYNTDEDIALRSPSWVANVKELESIYVQRVKAYVELSAVGDIESAAHNIGEACRCRQHLLAVTGADMLGANRA